MFTSLIVLSDPHSTDRANVLYTDRDATVMRDGHSLYVRLGQEFEFGGFRYRVTNTGLDCYSTHPHMEGIRMGSLRPPTRDHHD